MNPYRITINGVDISEHVTDIRMEAGMSQFSPFIRRGSRTLTFSMNMPHGLDIPNDPASRAGYLADGNHHFQPDVKPKCKQCGKEETECQAITNAPGYDPDGYRGLPLPPPVW